MKKSDKSKGTEDILPKIRLGIFRPSDHALTFDDIALIDDNLDLEPYDRNIGAPIDTSLPTKILMVVCMTCVEGSVDLTLNQADFHMERNDLLLGTPGFIAEKIKMSENCRIIIFTTSNDLLSKSPLKGAETVRKWLIQHGGPVVIHLGEELCGTYVNSYRSFRKAYELAAMEYHPEILMSFTHTALALLATWLTKEVNSSNAVAVPRKKELVLKFLSDVHEFCNVNRSVSFYAEKCCLSPKYFARLITEALGKKPGDIIKENVILEAKVMLISKSYSVQQVSDKLNFPNSSFFCKYFKAATGCSPRKYQLNGEKATMKAASKNQ